MLKFILGRSGYGKSQQIINEIEEQVKEGTQGIILMCPEQFSFNMERKLLKLLGDSNFSKIDCLSMTRLCGEVKKRYNTSPLPTLTSGGKAVLMKQAIDNCKSKLELFEQKSGYSSFISSMIKIYDEMKSCNLDNDKIASIGSTLDENLLGKKLHDISIIMSEYDNLIEHRYLDPTGDLSRLYQTLCDKDFFVGKSIYIDSFNGFVAQEYKILEIIISQAKSVTIALDGDNEISPYSDSLFSYVNNTVSILKNIAEEYNVKYHFEYLDTNYRTEKWDLKLYEKNLFSYTPVKSDKSTENIELYLSKSISDECSQVARKIKYFLRHGYRARDITVFSRDLNKYLSALSSAFAKYDVPFFVDERQPIKNQPAIVFCEYLMRIINYSFCSDDIIGLAKTGLTELTDIQINNLENYVYIWNITGSQWKRDFTKSTKGFSSEITDADAKAISALNISRKTLIEPVLSFQRKVKDANAKTVCEALYNALIAFKVNKRLNICANELFENGKSALALEQGTSWDILMNVINQLAQSLDDTVISIKDFSSLFSLMIASEELGTLPAGIDNVQFGQADRMRTDNPKIAFLIGANEGEFPQNVSISGLLTDKERKILAQNDFKLYSYGEILTVQEKYFAYKACTAPSEKLIISYSGNVGNNCTPSEIITSLEETFDGIKKYSYDDLSELDLIESEESAFELMAKKYTDNSAFYSSLKKYFEKDSRIDAIKHIASNEKYEIKDKTKALNLYNKDIFVSASRIEEYYNCRFRYFCKFGIGAKIMNKAEINPMQRGTLIHYVLEHILKDVGSKEIANKNSSQIKSLVDKYMKQYFVHEMGNIDDVTERFKYNYNRIGKITVSVVERLANEFKNCDFEAKAFELKIDKDADVKPGIYRLDDGTISLTGSVDRVDTFEKNGEQYVRVIDYKTGKKEFRLSDIMYGINLQMFIYLFSVCYDKNCKFSGIPAGVLYQHSSRDVINSNSGRETEESIASEEEKSFIPVGIILDDENNHIIDNMDKSLANSGNGKSKFIPVVKKGDTYAGSIANLELLGGIERKISSLIKEMGNDLHNGLIDQNPINSKNHSKTCEYCDYNSICLMTQSLAPRECDEIDENSVVEELMKGTDDYGNQMD